MTAPAFPTDPLQHRVIVAGADAQVAGYDFALVLLGQNTCEKATAFLTSKPLWSQWQGVRKGTCVRCFGPTLGVIEDHLPAVILDEMAHEISE